MGNKVITILTLATNPRSLCLFFNFSVDPGTLLLEEFNEVKHNDFYHILKLRMDFEFNNIDKHILPDDNT